MAITVCKIDTFETYIAKMTYYQVIKRLHGHKRNFCILHNNQHFPVTLTASKISSGHFLYKYAQQAVVNYYQNILCQAAILHSVVISIYLHICNT